ncbi:MAG: DUF4342 domain-containing protein [Deinococcales bacterium]
MSEDRKGRTIIENIEVAGGQLVDKVKELFEDASARKVIIRNSDGNELLTVPLTLGVVGGGLIAFAAPILAAVGAVAALVTKVQLEVVRTVDMAEDDNESLDANDDA